MLLISNPPICEADTGFEQRICFQGQLFKHQTKAKWDRPNPSGKRGFLLLG